MSTTVTFYRISGTFIEMNHDTIVPWHRTQIGPPRKFTGVLEISSSQRKSLGFIKDLYGVARVYQVKFRNGTLSFKKRYEGQVSKYRILYDFRKDQDHSYKGEYIMSRKHNGFIDETFGCKATISLKSCTEGAFRKRLAEIRKT